MKRRDLMKRLVQIAKDQGVEMSEEEGAKHTKVVIGTHRTTVPRHNEIDERLARAIIRQVGGK